MVVFGIAAILALVLATPGLRHQIPGLRPDASARIAGAFLYQQQRSLSCEYASVHIAASMLGYGLTEYDIEATVPLHENPHKGYRGNILGTWGNTADYGVYNAPLAAGLEELGIPHDAYYGDRADLERHLRDGHPTVVWLGMRGEGYSADHWDSDGDRYQLTTYMHVMTAYGFDESGVYLTDPGTAVWRHYSWDEFMTMWNVMDGMALSILP
jgi:uncharacterized protein YvpB